MYPTGKGMFIWQMPRCGTPFQVASEAADAGFDHLQIKIADGPSWRYNVVNNVDLAAQLAQFAGERAIDVWGWVFVYGDNPIGEARLAASRVRETGVVGLVVNAEGAYKRKPAQAAAYMRELRTLLGPRIPIGLSSYRYPSLHPELPWREFRQGIDFDQPQVYWMLAHNPAEQLMRSYTEFEGLSPELPYVPTGAAYREHGWQPTVSEIETFMQAVREMALPGFNLWEWYPARYVLPPAAWQAISAFSLPGAPAPVPAPGPRLVRVNTGTLFLRSAPVVTPATVVGSTQQGMVWEIDGEVRDVAGRLWLRSGPTAHMAGWLCEEID